MGELKRRKEYAKKTGQRLKFKGDQYKGKRSSNKVRYLVIGKRNESFFG